MMTKTVVSSICAITAVAALSFSLTTGCNGGSSQTGTAGTSGQGAAGTAAGVGAAGTGAAGTSAAGTAGGAAGMKADGGTDGPVAIANCSAPAKADQPIAKLTETGCVDPKNPTKMAAIVLPYEVNSPLWSDNADKFRGMVIPAGKKIHVKDCVATPTECPAGAQDDGKWVLPVGTVLVKSFGFDGKLIETRLLVHAEADTWNGYSYQWNEAQTEATIVPPDEDPSLNNMRLKVMFNTGTGAPKSWVFPYRFDCNGCHTKPAGGSLGLETRQLNRPMAGATPAMNQLAFLMSKNVFEAAPKTLPAYVLPYDGQLGKAPTGMLEQRARSYLNANCAYCHRPDGDVVMWLDFRNDTTLKNTGACGATPMKGNVGVDGALTLKPGKPMESAMWLRMHAPWTGDKTRMPQLATYIVDDAGLKLIGDWITSVTTCPP